jgi:hypothetical protein
MQDEKKDFKGFVKTFKKKVRDWKSKHLWTARFLEYILLLGLVSFVIALIFKFFNLIYTEPTSARYMLSALVQSQAAIIAIVVSLTFIVAQLTASAYSPRVIRIFRDNPDMWILLLFYGVSIFYGLLVLKMIRGAEDTSQIVISNISLEACISYVYALGISTFAILCLYIWNIMGLLTSETIIKRLQIEITRDKILNSEEDPIQPIMDIVHGSIMKYDLETTRVGLKAVTDRVIKIINSDDEEEISGHFCKHLERVGKLAVSKTDIESTEEVIENFEVFGKSTAEKKLEDATANTAMFLEAVGEDAAEKVFVVATWRAVESLGNIGKTAAEKDLEKATSQVALSLGVFGRSTAEKGFESATKKVAISLGDVGKAAAGKGLESATQRVVESLAALGRTAVEKRLKEVAREAAKNLASLTLLSEEIVKTAIQDYKSRLEEHDRESFQKFMKLYEQELEKLRVKRRT